MNIKLKKQIKCKTDFLMDPSFQGINRLLALSFKDETDRESQKKYCLSTVKIKDYNVLINGKNFFHQTIKNDLTIYDNI